jgi:hypothetical protein
LGRQRRPAVLDALVQEACFDDGIVGSRLCGIIAIGEYFAEELVAFLPDGADGLGLFGWRWGWVVDVEDYGRGVAPVWAEDLGV